MSRTLAAVGLALLTAVFGSVRAPEAEAALRKVRIAGSFNQPVHVTSVRGGRSGRLFVVEQRGIIRVVENGRVRRTPFLDIRGLVSCCGERGLLSVAFHPNYAQNRFLYVNYTNRSGDTRVARFRSNFFRALKSTRKILLAVAQPRAQHNGGQLLFGPGGNLHVFMGDGGLGGDRAQNLSSRLGKIVRRSGSRWQIVGYGLRNPWRASFDRTTGDLWIGDVGQTDWEEIDFTPKGAPGRENYGWNHFEGNAVYPGGDALNPDGHYVAPIRVYGHGPECSVIGGFVYRGAGIPTARGRYFYGDLCGGRVWSFRRSGGAVSGHRTEPFRVPLLTSFGEGPRGELYFVSHGGTLYRLGRR